MPPPPPKLYPIRADTTDFSGIDLRIGEGIIFSGSFPEGLNPIDGNYTYNKTDKNSLELGNITIISETNEETGDTTQSVDMGKGTRIIRGFIGLGEGDLRPAGQNAVGIMLNNGNKSLTVGATGIISTSDLLLSTGVNGNLNLVGNQLTTTVAAGGFTEKYLVVYINNVSYKMALLGMGDGV